MKESCKTCTNADYNIGNMDQTMPCFDSQPNQTNNKKGGSSVRIRCRNLGFTVSLCAHAAGHKMPAFCILKEPSGKIQNFIKLYCTWECSCYSDKKCGNSSKSLQRMGLQSMRCKWKQCYGPTYFESCTYPRKCMKPHQRL